MTTNDAGLDPFEDHLRREPLPNAGIRIILLSDLSSANASSVIAALADQLAEMGRPVECCVIPIAGDGLARSL